MDATSIVFDVIIPAAALTKTFSTGILALCQALALAVGHKKRTGEVTEGLIG
jgi:hypothetical protein